ncbi:PTS system, glucitol/sorbitol-specific IIA component [Paenibacillus sophorae]|uniref:PTS glucitol/sorbitol transporter subunit IIA n=1 Tax=Paenibacillus sophorae TaxID=1333845 RepID=A0A1H8LDL0_9BACL|nr:PTS glucitol/sorbitol transporter subunit IIA [Paenibacillus sophorae]QWU17325.1 PTS glucitol/sorbitol transporter subunit IIA [Paenibacillus sophorae]SEO03207.1 PTS system, glucitol/sorbitol-specific IIA component [Paenibacillus sophorae]
MQTVYQTRITQIGSSVFDFIEDKIFVLFGENAPSDVADYCLLIHVNDVEGEIEKGDVLLLDGIEYTITSVGSKVARNLKLLGHITLQFDGRETEGLPGTLYLENKDFHKPGIGGEIKIIKK